MSNEFNKICSLINNKTNVQDEKAFKIASVTLICDVMHNIFDANEKEQGKYCYLFQTQLNLRLEELNNIKDSIELDQDSVTEKVGYIKKELNNNKFEIMEFLKILNKFIVLDGCNAKSYGKFETIRDKFLEEFY